MEKWQESRVFHVVYDVLHFGFVWNGSAQKTRNPKLAGGFVFLFSSSVKDA